MTQRVITGLEKLLNDNEATTKYSGNIGYLCHSASIDSEYTHGLERMIDLFGNRLKKVFGPQHGFVTDVQDNMVESDHYVHPYFKRPVYSLYSETRTPTDEMLEGLDTIFVDMQDVGTRIYTYIYTMTMLMDACAPKGIKVVVLDRPNPINAKTIEGNILNTEFASFVGMHPMPIRHALTIGEVALMHNKNWAKKECDLEIIKLDNYTRDMSFEDTSLPWVWPSPNIPTVDTCFTFPATVMVEGTMLSEGRGTTRPLEVIGHPDIDAFTFYKDVLESKFKNENFQGCILRPLIFQPTFQKHGGTPCGGVQIHVTNRDTCTPWRLGQFLIKEMYHHLGDKFSWKTDQYEYVDNHSPIDVINGTDLIRKWIESNGSMDALTEIEMPGRENYLNKRSEILIY